MGRDVLRAGAFALMLGVATSASAYTVLGAGDCGRWVKEKRPTDRAWLLGFLSGLNAMFSGKTATDPLASQRSGDQIILWVDNYCRAYPLKPLEEAAYEVYLQVIPNLMK